MPTLLTTAPIAGRYVYLKELGQGGSGRLIGVHDELSGHDRALKVVQPEHAERLRWEFEQLAGLRHPGLAQVLELLELDVATGPPFDLPAGAALLVQELAEGVQAQERCVRAGPGRAAVAVSIALSVVRTLAAIHREGLVHGDIKPSNIVVPDDPAAAMLVDLGTAGPAGRSASLSGTPRYFAPEVWLGERSASSDLYSLGLTLFELLGGERPSGRDDAPSRGTLSRLSEPRGAWGPWGEAPSAQIPVLAALVPADLRVPGPEALGALVRELLHPEPSERPRNASEVLGRLASLARELGLKADVRDTLGDTRLPAEQAARALNRPLIGREKEHQELLRALGAQKVLRVSGPEGVGRSRLIREVVRTFQAERARTGQHVPSYLELDGRTEPPLPRAPLVVHVQSGFSVEDAEAFVERSSLLGAEAWVILEQASTVASGELERSSDSDVPRSESTHLRLGPLEPPAMRALLHHLLEDSPPPALLAAAQKASGGLPGRLCRLFAACHREAEDPRRPESLSAQAALLGGGEKVPLAGQELAELLALCDGGLTTHNLRALRPEADGTVSEGSRAGTRQAQDEGAWRGGREALRHAGLLRIGDKGALSIDAATGARLRRELPDDARRHWLNRLAKLELSPVSYARLVCVDDPARALHLFQEAIQELREKGALEAATALGEEAMQLLPSAGVNLRLVLADILRAQAKEERALTLLEACPTAGAYRAELCRLLGQDKRALQEASAVLDGPAGLDASEDSEAGLLARVVLCRIALRRGELDRATQCLGQAPENQPSGRSVSSAMAARHFETQSLLALMSGRVEHAAKAAGRALSMAQPGTAAQARAEATLAMVNQARGLHEESGRAYGRAAALARKIGERHAAANYCANQGLSLLEQGQLGPAIEALREACLGLIQIRRNADAGRALYNLANALFLAGDVVGAEDAALRAQVKSRGAGDQETWAHVRLLMIGLSPSRGPVEERRVLSELLMGKGLGGPGTQLSENLVTEVRARLARVLIAAGELEGARRYLAPFSRHADQGSVERHWQICLAEAELCLCSGDRAGAQREFTQARESARGAGWEARLRTALHIAEMMHRSAMEGGDQILSEARGLLDLAASTLEGAARARFRTVAAYARAFHTTPTASRDTPPGEESLRLLGRWAKRLVRERRLQALQELVVDAAVEVSGAERGFLLARSNGLVESGRGAEFVSDTAFVVVAARAFGASLPADAYPSFSVISRALSHRRPVFTTDASEDERLFSAQSVHGLNLRSILALPMGVGGSLSFVLYLDDALRPGAFAESTLNVVQDLSEIAAGSLEAAQILENERERLRALQAEGLALQSRLAGQSTELGQLRKTLRDRASLPAFDGIVAQSAQMLKVLSLVSAVAPSDAPVLVLGESGTGKELIARALHLASGRSAAPYVSENCSAIPDTLLESTLFGHVKGAFTGASHDRRGLFELADGGTLFLDEIGEMGAPMQAKLLRVLQDGQLRPVGGEQVRRVDVRLLSATHRDLPAMVAAGEFRQDLFYRISVVPIELPALRERCEDIPVLVEHFLARYGGDKEPGISAAALRALLGYRWPGNIRELENEIRRALLFLDAGRIELADLSPSIRGEEQSATTGQFDLKSQVNALERTLIGRALKATSGNQTKAAQMLQVSRYGLQKMIKRLGLKKP